MMFSKIKGTLDECLVDRIILDVNGIGYEIILSTRTIDSLVLRINQEIKLFIHTITKEDGTNLYGFEDRKEKLWFIELLKINGIGAKVALNILSCLNIESLEICAFTKDESMLSNIPGLGKNLHQE